MRSTNGWASAPTGTGATARPDQPAGRRRIGRIAGAAITALLASTLVPGAVAPASAEVNPNPPVETQSGFPAFFDDGNVKLRLCTDGPGCLAQLPVPGDPLAFPTNFPEEAFWFNAEASEGNLGLYEAAIEATQAAPGFARLRFRLNNLVPGANYTITHPYGTDAFVADPVGVINDTTDTGCLAAPCDWNTVAAGFLGDFGPGVPATFLTQTNALPGSLGNLNAPGPVTGGPGGNVITVAGLNAGGQGVNTLTVTDFAVQGEIVDLPAGTPSRPDLVAASDTGRSSADNITNATLPTLAGTIPGFVVGTSAEVNVDLLVDGATTPAGSTTTVGGEYSVALTTALPPGPRSIVARSAAGTSLPLSLSVATTAPAVTLGTRPTNNTADSTPTFTFTGDPGATFECRLLPSVSTFAPCASPMTFAAQIDGEYTFNVRAVDRVGNTSVPASFAWRIGAAVTRLSDFNQDGRTDLVARDSAGRLWLYPGNGTGAFLPRRLMATGWNVFTQIVTPGDVTGDGNADVMARNKAGALRLYPGNGRGGFLASRQIGASGWNAMSVITGAGLMSGDALPDVMARDSAGRLWLYPTRANGTFQTRRLIGRSGWNAMTAIMGAGDLSGDGRADLLARDRAGKLWLYRGDGTGRFATRTPAGTGWQGMTALVTPGNWDRKSGNDLIARDSAGRLWLYPGNNAGKLTQRRQIGTGWRGYTIA